MKKNMKLAIALGLAGVILLVFSIVWITVIEPDLEKLPSDLDETFTIDATLKVEGAFQSLIALETSQVSIERHQQAIESDGGTLIIQETFTPSVEIPEVGITQMTLTMAVDRESREYLTGYAEVDREREALWAYPVGVKKQDYILWSDTAGSAPYARYVGEEKIDGLKVYNFLTDEKGIAYEIDLGTGPLPLVMDFTIEEKVEPHTGITVDGKNTQQFFLAGADGGKTLVGTMIRKYSDATVDEKISDAKKYRTQLLWATRYGLWMGISLGVLLLVAGCWLTLRARRLDAVS